MPYQNAFKILPLGSLILQFNARIKEQPEHAPLTDISILCPLAQMVSDVFALATNPQWKASCYILAKRDRILCG